MAVSRRDVVVTVRFTEQEAEALRRAADESEKSVSALVRDATLHTIRPGSASVSSSTGTAMYAVAATGTGFSGQIVGGEGQPVGGNLEVPSS